MNNLPNEIIDNIFSFINSKTLYDCHNVCKTWRQIIVQRFWAPQLALFADKDHNLKQHFIAAGWNKSDCDDELIRKLYLKSTLDLQWRWLNSEPAIEDNLVQQYTPENFHTEKVTAFLLYKDKLFLSLANGNVERRTRNSCLNASKCSNSFVERKVILSSELIPNLPANEQHNDEHFMLGSCPLALTGREGNILVTVEPRKRQDVFLWDADSEQSLCKLSTPPDLGPQRRIYDLAASTTHIICLASWSLIVWTLPSKLSDDCCVKPIILHDFEPVQEFQNWLECHTVEMNSLYVVSLATRIRFPPNDGGSRSESFINVRKFHDNQSDRKASSLDFDRNINHPFPKRGKNNRVDIDRIKLSPTKHLLAVLQVEKSPRNEVDQNEDVSDDDSSDSFSSHFRGYVYAVRIFDLVKGGELIFTLPISSSIFSMVRVPVQWLAPSPVGHATRNCDEMLGGSEKLFFKFVPKPDCIEEVQLGVWDSESQMTTTLKTVKLFASSDLLNITHSQITHLYNKFPSAPNYEAYVGELNFEDESDINVPWTDFRVNALSDGSETVSSQPTELSVPEFQVRAAFYDFWNEST